MLLFCRKTYRDLFLMKVTLCFEHHSVRTRPLFESGTFVTVHDEPWEMTDELIATHLEEYGTVHSIRRVFNQSLLPEEVFEGRRVLRMTAEKDIPCFLKFGPLLLRIFYPRQPKACWKCASPDHIGRECPSNLCFNSGHQAHQCRERIRCSLSKSDHYLADDCPGNWDRRTFAQRTPQRLEEPVDEEPPVPKMSRTWITLTIPRKNKQKPPRHPLRSSLTIQYMMRTRKLRYPW